MINLTELVVPTVLILAACYYAWEKFYPHLIQTKPYDFVYLDITGGYHYHTKDCPVINHGTFKENYKPYPFHMVKCLLPSIGQHYVPCPFCFAGKMVTTDDINDKVNK